MLIADGTLVTARDCTIAEQSKNYRHHPDRQVFFDANTQLIVVAGRPQPGNRNDCKA